jgi:hypothetical protein
MRLPKVRWKTLRTIWLCRTMALFVGGAAPVAVVEAETPAVVVTASR